MLWWELIAGSAGIEVLAVQRAGEFDFEGLAYRYSW
jgi:hypothetical protein